MPHLSGFIHHFVKQMTEKEAVLAFVLALLAAVGALLIGERIFFGEYVTTDEHSYIFEAWLFL